MGCLGSQGSYLTARKPPWDWGRMGWDGGDSTKSVDTAECWGMVGQRKLFSVVTGKRNISKVNAGLG